MRKLISLFATTAILLSTTAGCQSPGAGLIATGEFVVETKQELMKDYGEALAASNALRDQGLEPTITFEDEEKVMAALEKYRKANLAFEAATRSYQAASTEEKKGLVPKLEAAVEALQDMQSELVDLVKSLL